VRAGAGGGEDTKKGVEVEQLERERERGADTWVHRHVVSTSPKPPSKIGHGRI
jgi:hypothetical protein